MPTTAGSCDLYGRDSVIDADVHVLAYASLSLHLSVCLQR